MIIKKQKQNIIAIDEAGRGPLAGPIAVAAVAAKANDKLRIINERLLKNIRDSKKLSARQRNIWFKVIKDNFEYKVAMVGPEIIDRLGINSATRLAISRIIKRFDVAPDLILMDGGLRAPKQYNQRTIIKGDEKVPLVAAASIMAKVKRDRKMTLLHKNYPEYRLDRHKGYGTALHYKMIKKNGLSFFHRRSFLKNLCLSKNS